MADETSNPSFLKSTWEGMKGAIKGLLAGAGFGAVVGVAGGAIIGAMTGDIATGMRIGAELMTGLFASVGVTAGTMTGVVKSRESGKVSIEDAVKAVQVSMAQGMAVEQMRAQAMESKWQDKIAQERANPTIDTGQRLHS